MFEDKQRMLSLLASIAAFGFVLSVWLVGLILWLKRRNIKEGEVRERLKIVQDQGHGQSGRVLRLWHEGQEQLTSVPGIATANLNEWIEKLRLDAGIETPAVTIAFMLASVMCIIATIAYLISGHVVVGISAPIAVVIIYWIYIKQRISKRSAVFERQLIDALELATRSLKVGHPLVGAFRLISEEVPAPLGTLFGEVCQQQALGMGMDEALRNVATRSASEDMKLFATSVMIQMRTGGNLGDMMQRLAGVIRERNRLQRRVKVLTAQTQFSKRILLAMPFLVFVFLTLVNPTYMQPLFVTFVGQVIAVCALIGLFLGWITMNWLSKLTP